MSETSVSFLAKYEGLYASVQQDFPLSSVPGFSMFFMRSVHVWVLALRAAQSLCSEMQEVFPISIGELDDKNTLRSALIANEITTFFVLFTQSDSKKRKFYPEREPSKQFETTLHRLLHCLLWSQFLILNKNIGSFKQEVEHVYVPLIQMQIHLKAIVETQPSSIASEGLKALLERVETVLDTAGTLLRIQSAQDLAQSPFLEPYVITASCLCFCCDNCSQKYSYPYSGNIRTQILKFGKGRKINECDILPALLEKVRDVVKADSPVSPKIERSFMLAVFFPGFVFSREAKSGKEEVIDVTEEEVTDVAVATSSSDTTFLAELNNLRNTVTEFNTSMISIIDKLISDYKTSQNK